MPLVQARCTNCGGNLEVDNAKDAAICPYCQTAYIVEKAINLYQATISVDDLYAGKYKHELEKADIFINDRNYEKAEKVLTDLMDEYPAEKFELGRRMLISHL